MLQEAVDAWIDNNSPIRPAVTPLLASGPPLTLKSLLTAQRQARRFRHNLWESVDLTTDVSYRSRVGIKIVSVARSPKTMAWRLFVSRICHWPATNYRGMAHKSVVLPKND